MSVQRQQRRINSPPINCRSRRRFHHRWRDDTLGESAGRRISARTSTLDRVCDSSSTSGSSINSLICAGVSASGPQASVPWSHRSPERRPSRVTENRPIWGLQPARMSRSSPRQFRRFHTDHSGLQRDVEDRKSETGTRTRRHDEIEFFFLRLLRIDGHMMQSEDRRGAFRAQW